MHMGAAAAPAGDGEPRAEAASRPWPRSTTSSVPPPRVTCIEPGRTSLPALLRRRARTLTPFSQYGPLFCVAVVVLPPTHTDDMTSSQNRKRWPLRPSAWRVSWFCSHPAGVSVLSAAERQARGSTATRWARARAATASIVVCALPGQGMGSTP